MASIESYETKAGKRYRVRYRTAENRSTDKGGFKTKREAELFRSTVEVSKSRGEFIQDSAGRRKISELGPVWLEGKRVLKPSSYAPLEASWRNYVLPKWGNRAVGSIRTTEVQQWVTELSRGADLSKAKSSTVVLRAFGILAGILDAAVNDRLLARNPARGIDLPRKPKKSKTYLTSVQVDQLAKASKHPAIIYLMAYTGLRWGEVCALRVKHVNFLKRRISVEENAVRVRGVIHVGTPKTHETRTVPVPGFILKLLAVQAEGKESSEILFPGDGGGYMAEPRAGGSNRSWFAQALQAADVPRVTPHDLRHTAASLAVQSGANVKAVQRMLGHASAAMTLDTYADLFDEDLDAVADAMDRQRSESCG